MPVSYSIDPVKRRVVNVATGVMTMADLIEAQRLVRSDPAFQRDYDHLFDLSNVESATIAGDDLRDLASSSIFSATSRRAFVVTKPVVYGLGRMFQAWIGDSGERMGLFGSREEAERWLDVVGLAICLGLGAG